MTELLDVVIVGGGPAGLSAALALGRSRRNVAILDRGARRNTRAERIHNFVTRDGTPPEEFRRIGRAELAHYSTVSHLEMEASSIRRSGNGFEVNTPTHTLKTRKILLCTGLIDEPLAIPGAAELWGHAIFQCPYCHGWENRDQRWGYLLPVAERLEFALMLQTWSPEVTVFTQGRLDLPRSGEERLRERGVHIERRPITRLLAQATPKGPRLAGVTLADDTVAACDALFAHPNQRQVPLVAQLGLALDENGLVVADPFTRETSVAGVYAAGDLTTRLQGAIFAAAAGTQAATMINHELAVS